MTRVEIASLVREARELDSDVIIEPDEDWDSLDHLKVMDLLTERYPLMVERIDLSEANSLARLEALLGDA